MYQPFADSSYNLQFVAFQISEILRMGLGFDARNRVFMPVEHVNFVGVREGVDNPFIIDNDGKEQFYQRELCWSSIDKTNLIDAIYNYSDIGKFVVVRRSYDYLEKMIKAGHREGLGFHELVDGKQRLNCIAEFMQDMWPDSNGKFYSDLDQIEKRKFTSYNKCTVAIMDEATPAQVKRAFLNVNHTGKPMSSEHIALIKSLNV